MANGREYEKRLATVREYFHHPTSQRSAYFQAEEDGVYSMSESQWRKDCEVLLNRRLLTEIHTNGKAGRPKYVEMRQAFDLEKMFQIFDWALLPEDHPYPLHVRVFNQTDDQILEWINKVFDHWEWDQFGEFLKMIKDQSEYILRMWRVYLASKPAEWVAEKRELADQRQAEASRESNSD